MVWCTALVYYCTFSSQRARCKNTRELVCAILGIGPCTASSLLSCLNRCVTYPLSTHYPCGVYMLNNLPLPTHTIAKKHQVHHVCTKHPPTSNRYGFTQAELEAAVHSAREIMEGPFESWQHLRASDMYAQQSNWGVAGTHAKEAGVLPNGAQRAKQMRPGSVAIKKGCSGNKAARGEGKQGNRAAGGGATKAAGQPKTTQRRGAAPPNTPRAGA